MHALRHPTRIRTALLATLSAAVIVAAAPAAHAAIIDRNVSLTLDPAQIASGGTSWSAGFAIDPFTVDVGDTVNVNVQFAGGARLALFDDDNDVNISQAVIFTDQVIIVDNDGSFSFNDVLGDFNNPPLAGSFTSNSTGTGMFFLGADLTDSSFSFSGFSYTLANLDSASFPSTYDRGSVIFRNAAAFEILDASVPAPGTLLLGLLGLGLMARARRR